MKIPSCPPHPDSLMPIQSILYPPTTILTAPTPPAPVSNPGVDSNELFTSYPPINMDNNFSPQTPHHHPNTTSYMNVIPPRRKATSHNFHSDSDPSKFLFQVFSCMVMLVGVFIILMFFFQFEKTFLKL